MVEKNRVAKIFWILEIFLAAGILCTVSCVAAESESWETLNANVVALYRQGKSTQALPLAQEALEVARLTYGIEDPSVATSLNNLAALYHSLGRYEEAEPLYKQALAIDEKFWGADDPRGIAPRDNLKHLSRVKGPPTPSDPGQKASGPPPNDPTPVRPALRRNSKWNKEEEASWIQQEFTVATGYRRDHFDWNIAGDSNGQNPNILSELTWKNLEIYQVGGKGTLTAGKYLSLRGALDFGWIYNGDNQDSDYNLDDRGGEFSRSNNKANDGSVLDASIGMGVPWKTQVGTHPFRITPLAGYSYHEQRLKILKGFQAIPATGPFGGLGSEYEAKWKGPWLGLDLWLKPAARWTLLGTFEYHWADYRADARWNLRTDLAQPKSFRHSADGSGIVGSLGIGYSLPNEWILNMSGQIQDWSTDSGLDTTFYRNGTTAQTRLNEVNWDSFSVTLGATRRY